MSDLTEQDYQTARRALNECRAECLNIAYVVLTRDYGFSPKRVARAMKDVIEQLSDLDDETIPLIFEEGE